MGIPNEGAPAAKGRLLLFHHFHHYAVISSCSPPLHVSVGQLRWPVATIRLK